MYRSGEGGGGGRYVTPDLRYYWEGARGQYEHNKWDGKENNNVMPDVLKKCA